MDQVLANSGGPTSAGNTKRRHSHSHRIRVPSTVNPPRSCYRRLPGDSRRHTIPLRRIGRMLDARGCRDRLDATASHAARCVVGSPSDSCAIGRGSPADRSCDVRVHRDSSARPSMPNRHSANRSCDRHAPWIGRRKNHSERQTSRQVFS